MLDNVSFLMPFLLRIDFLQDAYVELIQVHYDTGLWFLSRYNMKNLCCSTHKSESLPHRPNPTISDHSGSYFYSLSNSLIFLTFPIT